MNFMYLTADESCRFNLLTVERHGGNFQPPLNLLHKDALDYLVEMVQNDLYYATLEEKTVLYGFSIIQNHIFSDGNKRTGLAAMDVFLRKNGKRFNPQLSPTHRGDKMIPNCSTSNSKEILEHFILQIADGTLTKDDMQDFIKNNLVDFNNKKS